MSKYDDLVKKLKEIFQIDKPELDFGVYRILNARSVEISDYLENRLKAKVLESLSQAGTASKESLKHELAEAEKNATSLGVSPDSVPKVKELRQKISENGLGVSEHENAVFTYLLTFFSRYYDNGDFISQRRYKGNAYAIPYSGEEVVLHWANKDQYYTKSGENFSNYAFKLDDGRTVSFKLVTADTAKDNRKDEEKERLFVLIDEHVRTLVDDDGNEYDETLFPLEEHNGELIIRFEYKATSKGVKQEDQIKNAVKFILQHETVKTKWFDLASREPTESNPQRTLLEKCLINYTSKNTADYFIHKDLNRFLKDELDFYIKNEVMNLDDVQNAEEFSDIEKNLRLIQTLRSIALDLITFLGQLENFQKMLYLKKKFVVATHYSITLDRIPESLYPEIAANESQWEQWQTLGMLEIDKNDLFNHAKSGSIEYLKAHQSLMVDTELFLANFKYELLSKLDNLDETLDGLLINGDNFQALKLIEKKYESSVKAIYIDPPYNTSASEIIYKNNYKHSSWLSFMHERLLISKSLMSEDGIIEMAIDDAENSQAKLMMDDLFQSDNFVATIAIQQNPRGRADAKHISPSHEYLHLYAKNYDSLITNELEQTEDELTEKYKKNDSSSAYRELPFKRSGSNSSRSDRPNLFYSIYYNPILDKLSLNKDSEDFVEILPLDSNGEEKVWRWGAGKAESLFQTEFIVKNNGIGYTINLKDRIKNTIKPKSFWYGPKHDASSHGTMLLKSMFEKSIFSYPKSINTVMDALLIGSKNDSLILDYFAGSGTTGAAVIKLNRNDNGRRKYILVEQGEYFDTVTKPRIQKTVYSDKWKNNFPVDSVGISHAIKILKIESYEDALNNIQLKRSLPQQDLLNQLPAKAKEDYMMSYMLNIEAKDSLLSVKNFKSPFNYKLKVAVDSAGAYEEKSVDLLETFNYLIGLSVEQINYQLPQGFVTVIGKLPTGEKTLVLWRDIEDVDYLALNKLCDRLAINPSDNEFDIVYINGDHNIPSAFTSTEAEGGITKRLALRQIEPEFLSRMFSTDNF